MKKLFNLVAAVLLAAIIVSCGSNPSQKYYKSIPTDLTQCASVPLTSGKFLEWLLPL